MEVCSIVDISRDVVMLSEVVIMGLVSSLVVDSMSPEEVVTFVSTPSVVYTAVRASRTKYVKNEHES